MSVSRGFYRHWKGHCYYVHGVACLKHEGDRRVVVYTSVKTEEGAEGFDFLARDESEFEQWLNDLGADGRVVRVRRFARVTDPERSVVPR
jgi:hypothetical protein